MDAAGLQGPEQVPVQDQGRHQGLVVLEEVVVLSEVVVVGLVIVVVAAK